MNQLSYVPPLLKDNFVLRSSCSNCSINELESQKKTQILLAQSTDAQYCTVRCGIVVRSESWIRRRVYPRSGHRPSTRVKHDKVSCFSLLSRTDELHSKLRCSLQLIDRVRVVLRRCAVRCSNGCQSSQYPSAMAPYALRYPRANQTHYFQWLLFPL